MLLFIGFSQMPGDSTRKQHIASKSLISTKQKCWSDAIATAKECMKLVDMLEFRQRYLRQYVTCGWNLTVCNIFLQHMLKSVFLASLVVARLGCVMNIFFCNSKMFIGFVWTTPCRAECATMDDLPFSMPCWPIFPFFPTAAECLSWMSVAQGHGINSKKNCLLWFCACTSTNSLRMTHAKKMWKSDWCLPVVKKLFCEVVNIESNTFLYQICRKTCARLALACALDFSVVGACTWFCECFIFM